jgi:hypothetical protein
MVAALLSWFARQLFVLRFETWWQRKLVFEILEIFFIAITLN